MTPRRHVAVDQMPQGNVETFDHNSAVKVAAALGHRDDFVIDLRIDGKVESYLRQSAAESVAGSKPLRFTRRALDIGTACVALIATLPFFLGIAFVSSVTSRGPILFRQERVGRGGKLFTCYKFRSMHVDAAERLADLLATDEQFRAQWERDQKVRNDPRTTTIGRFLRKTSLDEIPQLFNVIKGDMSIIGPRPIIPEETPRYGNAMQTVLSVRPGVTGLWQVSGRNALPYPERIALDLRYIDEQSLMLDAKILAKTITCVATGTGAS